MAGYFANGMTGAPTTVPIGLFAPCSTPRGTRDYVEALGQGAEERGFESVWVAEHVVGFDRPGRREVLAGERGTLDPFVLLSFLAAGTSSIRLGTGVTLISQRQPLFLAKETASVDWLSGGRLELGVGLGWISAEFEALQLRREDRAALADRNLELLRTLWTDEVSEYHSRGYDLNACRAYPKPVQGPHPPVHIGGHSDAALRRVARYGQGWYGFDLDVDAFCERLSALELALAVEGRSRSDVTVSVCPFLGPVDAGVVATYAKAGADRVIVFLPAETHDDLFPALDRLQPLTEVANKEGNVRSVANPAGNDVDGVVSGTT